MFKRNKLKMIHEKLKNNSGSISQQAVGSFPKIIRVGKLGESNEKIWIWIHVGVGGIPIFWTSLFMR